MATSTKPYLLRGLYEWCMDNGFTPHIAVWVNDYTQVPRQYVQDEQIVLNIGASACQNLLIDNEWVNFSARFGGKAEEIWIPVGHVVSFFARENGNGMGFEVEPYLVDSAADAPVEAESALHVVKTKEDSPTSDGDDTPPPAGGGGFLKIVK